MEYIAARNDKRVEGLAKAAAAAQVPTRLLLLKCQLYRLFDCKGAALCLRLCE